ncbi:putative membrane protein [freshwater metagenome]|uniref:Putative membrane protein n=1 Tax=freshwater metagenome TaxID=449393 RepID=A0A094QWI0_9ZZZZ
MKQRDIAPDVLRGFALLGILVVNIQFMGLNSGEGARGELTQGLANGTATFIIASIFAGKFYLLFSFLFGYSSNYIIRGDGANRARWVKRCFALIALGALHFTFLWHGDIIFLYGIFGLLLIPFFFRADRTLKIWTRIVFITSSTLVLLVGALVYIAERYLPTESFQAPMESKLDSVLVNGTFLEAIPARLEIWVYGITTGVFLQGGLAFAAFLLGLRMARSNFLSSPMDAKMNTSLMKKGFFIGAPIQIVAAIALVRNEHTAEPSEAIYLISLFTSFIAAPLMSIFFISVIRKMVEDKPSFVTWMVPAGKMSLTVYISQSIITSLIFGPWGLGLFQKLETWEVVLLALGIWLALVYLATIWLQKFSQGPLEKMVNTLTRNR